MKTSTLWPALACAACALAITHDARDGAAAQTRAPQPRSRGALALTQELTDEQLAPLLSDEPLPPPARLPARDESPQSSDAPRQRLSQALRMGEPTIIRVIRIDDRHARGVWILGEVLASSAQGSPPGSQRAFRAAGGVQCTSQELLEVGTTLFLIVRDAVIQDESGVATRALVFTSTNGPLTRATARRTDWVVTFPWGEALYKDLVTERRRP